VGCVVVEFRWKIFRLTSFPSYETWNQLGQIRKVLFLDVHNSKNNLVRNFSKTDSFKETSSLQDCIRNFRKIRRKSLLIL
jgi:hypothetical protein